MIANSKADIFVRPMEYLLNANYVYYTDAFMTLNYNPIQIIDKKSKDQIAFNLIDLFNFLIPSFDFLLLLASGLLFYFASLWLFAYFAKPAKFKQSQQFLILSFFYLLFLFFMIEFFNDNLSTENVILDTSYLLDSKEKILETKREFCFFEKSTELNYFAQV